MPEVTLRHLRQALSLYPRMISLIRLRAVTPCKRLPTLKPQKLNYSYKRKNVLLENKLFTENTVISFYKIYILYSNHIIFYWWKEKKIIVILKNCYWLLRLFIPSSSSHFFCQVTWLTCTWTTATCYIIQSSIYLHKKNT